MAGLDSVTAPSPTLGKPCQKRLQKVSNLTIARYKESNHSYPSPVPTVCQCDGIYLSGMNFVCADAHQRQSLLDRYSLAAFQFLPSTLKFFAFGNVNVSFSPNNAQPKSSIVSLPNLSISRGFISKLAIDPFSFPQKPGLPPSA